MTGLVAVLDPAWQRDAGGGRRGAQMHYALHDVDDMARTYTQSPPWSDVGKGLLWMWATEGALSMPRPGVVPDAYRLASALGFRVVCSWVWVKAMRAMWAGPESVTTETAWIPQPPGLGQWSRKAHEHLLMCVRGKVSPPPPSARPYSVIYAMRTKHSKKPEAAWSVIETVSAATMPATARRCEWNARKRRDQWEAYGALDGEDMPLRWEGTDGRH